MWLVQDWSVLPKTFVKNVGWDFVKEKGLNMVVINPSGVFGLTLLQVLEIGIMKYILGKLKGEYLQILIT